MCVSVDENNYALAGPRGDPQQDQQGQEQVQQAQGLLYEQQLLQGQGHLTNLREEEEIQHLGEQQQQVRGGHLIDLERASSLNEQDLARRRRMRVMSLQENMLRSKSELDLGGLRKYTATSRPHTQLVASPEKNTIQHSTLKQIRNTSLFVCFICALQRQNVYAVQSLKCESVELMPRGYHSKKTFFVLFFVSF